MRTVYLVGCGASKLDRPAPARELYTGSLFVAARRYVEERGATWLVLSARYGCIDPGQELAPYEMKLAKRGSELHHWGHCAAGTAIYLSSVWVDRERGLGPKAQPPRKFVFLCGVDYARPVADRLESWGYQTEQPLAGLQLGERLRWFKERHEEHTTPATAGTGGTET